jgi:hypothetical protein
MDHQGHQEQLVHKELKVHKVLLMDHLGPQEFLAYLA